VGGVSDDDWLLQKQPQSASETPPTFLIVMRPMTMAAAMMTPTMLEGLAGMSLPSAAE
jgi:hypothetical protein